MKKDGILLVVLLVFLLFLVMFALSNTCKDKQEYTNNEILTPIHDTCIYCGDSSLFTIHHVEHHKNFIVITPKYSIVCNNCGNYN